jgi:hypothetical protein
VENSIFEAYLRGRPLLAGGGGVGDSGDWARRANRT